MITFCVNHVEKRLRYIYVSKGNFHRKVKAIVKTIVYNNFWVNSKVLWSIDNIRVLSIFFFTFPHFTVKHYPQIGSHVLDTNLMAAFPLQFNFLKASGETLARILKTYTQWEERSNLPGWDYHILKPIWEFIRGKKFIIIYFEHLEEM